MTTSLKLLLVIPTILGTIVLGIISVWVLGKGKPNKKGQDKTSDKVERPSQEVSGAWVQEALQWAAVLATFITIALLLYFFAPGLREWLANHTPRPSVQPSAITGVQAGFSIPWGTVGLWVMWLLGTALALIIAFFTLDVIVHKPKSRWWIVSVVAVGLLVVTSVTYHNDVRVLRQSFVEKWAPRSR